MTAAKSRQLRQGADSFKCLMVHIQRIALSAPSTDTDADTTDFRAIVAAINHSLARDLVASPAGVQEGYLRAMADLLACTTLGVLPRTFDDSWNPIEQTDYAYRADGAA